MNKNNDIHNKLRSPQKLPSNYDWQDMKDGIMDRVTLNEHKAKTRKIKGSITKGLIILFVLCISRLTINLLRPSINSVNDLAIMASSDIALTNDDNKHNNQPVSNNSEVVENSNQSTIKSHTTTNKSLATLSKSSSSLSKYTNTTHTKDDQVSNPSSNKFYSEAETEVSISEEILKNASTEKQKTIPASAVNLENNIPSQLSHHTFRTQNLYIQPINTLDIPLLSASISRYLSLDASLEVIPVIEPAKNNYKRWNIMIYASANQWSNAYQNQDTGERLNQDERPLPSFELGLSAGYNLNRKWKLSTGLSYRRLESRLDFSEAWDTIVVREFVDVVINNFVNGDIVTDSLYKEAELETVATRQVIHHNSYTQYSIPISIERQWTFDKGWSGYLGTGLRYNFLRSGNGRTLNISNSDNRQFDVVDIDGSIFRHSFEILGSAGIQKLVTDCIFVDVKYYLTHRLSSFNSNFNPQLTHAAAVGIGVRF